MLDCEFVVLSPENFEEVVTFHDKHFLPQNPLVKVRNFARNILIWFSGEIKGH